jgi:serine/threonine protein kinase
VAKIFRGVYQGKAVAVKQYKSDVDAKEKKRQRMEFNLLRSLRDDHIIFFVGVVERPQFSIVTEYMTRGSLRDYLASGVRYTPDQLLLILRGIARGMEYLHSQRYD